MVNEVIRILSLRQNEVHPNREFAVKRDDFAKLPYEVFAGPANDCIDSGGYIFHHFIASPSYRQLYRDRPELIPIVMIRDLRDVIIANLYDKWDNVGQLIGEDKDMDTRLLHILRFPECLEQHDTLFNAKNALFWIRNKKTHVVRFENLVGEHGGGTDAKQRRAIIAIAKHLKLNPSSQTINRIQDNIFGSTPTFRRGQIGEWKTHFKPAHKQLFKEKFGELLIAFGYEKDNNW